MAGDRKETSKASIVSRYWECGIILSLLILGVVASLLIELNGWDLGISGRFFVSGGAHGGWVAAHDQPWRWLYEYGEIPPILLAAGAVWLYRAAQSGRVRRAYAKPCLVVILTMALGPGLLVNGILKNDWGRPRPADITAFGGPSHYLKVWQPGVPGGGKSFTCGHCSVGFAVASGSVVREHTSNSRGNRPGRWNTLWHPSGGYTYHSGRAFSHGRDLVRRDCARARGRTALPCVPHSRSDSRASFCDAARTHFRREGRFRALTDSREYTERH